VTFDPPINVTVPVRTVAPDEAIPVTATDESSFPVPLVVGMIFAPEAAIVYPAAFVESSDCKDL
jgi:hypothetical protein